MNNVILKAEDLDGYLSAADRDSLDKMEGLYLKLMEAFKGLKSGLQQERRGAEDSLISLYNEVGTLMQEICRQSPNIHVYSFLSPQEATRRRRA